MKQNPKKINSVGVVLLSMVFIVLSISSAFAMLNRAAVYCSTLGYENLTGLTQKGETALCRLPNNVLVDAYDFLTGKVALDWSYCAKMGYEAKRVENSEICRDCTVCVLPGGVEIEVSELMSLNVRESKCGDGSCATAEDFSNCPQDCPSGGIDDFCDGVQDLICDSDCVELGENDPDCPAVFVDIKPGSCPNPFEISNMPDKGKAVLPVAILGTAEFDVEDIDPETIRMKRTECIECSGVSPVRWSYEDVAEPFSDSSGCGCHKKGPDGYLDLSIKFDRAAIVDKLKLYDACGQTVSITIKAHTYGYQGFPIRARDCIFPKDEGGKKRQNK